jgi:arginyl-tRNA synthetase
MISANPFAAFRKECEVSLEDALSRAYPKVSVPSTALEPPPSPEFGELASSLCFELAKQVRMKPLEAAERIVKAIDVSKFPLIESVKVAGGGYINFYVNFPKCSALTIESVRTLNAEYGFVKTDEPKKIIVEHTSMNPIRPIHIGTARNSILGDAVARLLGAQGHTVFRHYYVDDVGRQTAVAAYGYEKLGRPKPEGKADHFIGAIYAITSCITEISRLKKEIEQGRERLTNEEISKLQRELDEWASVAADLEGRFPKLFKKLLDEIGKDEDPESEINALIRGYEAGEEKPKKLLREVSQLCLDSFKETLERAGIFFDSWDWESDFVWSGDVASVLNRLKETPYVFQVGKVLEFDAEKVAQNLNLKKGLGLREDYEIPSLTLVRADGSTLYTTRDISYSLWKFQRAEKVINVVGMEQTLSQLQLKLALCALGHVNLAENLIHFTYNLVRLPGHRMSGRTGRYITFDEVMDEAVERAYEEVSKRSPHLSEKEKRQISKVVGIGAVKYALVEVDPMKPVVFTWEQVLDFERNSAPYIQYSYARARSILKKASREPKNPDYALLTNPLERDITLMLARFPEAFTDAVESLKPNVIADFANNLADKFNSFYNALPVIKADSEKLSDARLALVDAVSIVLRNAFNILGIEVLERM